ncbi:MAG: FAD-binding oxidoreductase [Candidatus Margulisiibacteriota bacterium]
MLKKTDPSVIRSYLEDSSNLQGGHAEGVYLPENEAEVIEILKECSEKKTPLTISAGETGTTGGCIPFGGWILGTEKLNKLKDIDTKTASLEPAVTLETLEKETKKAGLLYPPDPTETTAWLGGTVATNASGSRSFRFGATRDWVKRLKVILSTGEVLELKRNDKCQMTNDKLMRPNYQIPNVKTAAGYYSKPEMDLIDLFIGSEGTLGVVTEIEVGLIPRFFDTFDLIAFFPNENDAVDFVEEARKKEALTLEFFDKNSLELLRSSYPKIPVNAGSAVYFECELTEKSGLSYLDEWGKLIEKHHAKLDDAWLGMNNKQKQELKDFRHAMPEHINEEFKKHNTIKFASDIAVPDSKFREMLDFYSSHLIPHTSHLFFVKFGHIGQNHLHVNLVPRKPEDIPLAQETIMKFVKKAVSLGGTCSAEHGIGKIKHPYLREMFGEAGILEMVRIKKHFDPAGILNQGNLFPKDLLK